ncbi:MAG TPA: hypothetical protein VGX94_09360 [Terriglobia bacterium]|nr:hypothetical protein [Terriglobia bacterium]
MDCVVSAERIAIDHFQSAIEHGVTQHLSDEYRLQVLPQPIQDESGRPGINVPGPLSTSYRGTGFDRGQG